MFSVLGTYIFTSRASSTKTRIETINPVPLKLYLLHIKSKFHENKD